MRQAFAVRFGRLTRWRPPGALSGPACAAATAQLGVVERHAAAVDEILSGNPSVASILSGEGSLDPTAILGLAA